LAEQVVPYLLGGVTAKAVNHIWGIDITYIRLVSGHFVYLAAVIDWYSRFVLSWELEQSLRQEFIQAAVSAALRRARPEIMNSDQGSHFTSPQYQQLLQAAGVTISMGGKGRAIDNVLTERLWRSVKYEEVYLSEYASPAAARQGLNE
jgi:putative transposase